MATKKTTSSVSMKDTEDNVKGAAVDSCEKKTIEKKSLEKSNETAKKPKEFKSTDIVIVRNGFQGGLAYKSAKTGEFYFWDEFGAEQEMDIGELRSAKNSDKAFFKNNWFMFDDPDVVKFLGVSMYYKNAINIDEFDEIFDMNVGEMVEMIDALPDGQKKAVAGRASELIAAGRIDSIKKVKALENCLGVTLSDL